MKKLTVTNTGVVLPSAVDTVSIGSYVSSAIGFAIGMISIIDPHAFGAQTGIAVQATIPLVSLAIASAIEFCNIWRHHSATSKVLSSGATIQTMTRTEYDLTFGSSTIALRAQTKEHQRQTHEPSTNVKVLT